MCGGGWTCLISLPNTNIACAMLCKHFFPVFYIYTYDVCGGIFAYFPGKRCLASWLGLKLRRGLQTMQSNPGGPRTNYRPRMRGGRGLKHVSIRYGAGSREGRQRGTLRRRPSAAPSGILTNKAPRHGRPGGGVRRGQPPETIFRHSWIRRDGGGASRRAPADGACGARARKGGGPCRARQFFRMRWRTGRSGGTLGWRQGRVPPFL